MYICLCIGFRVEGVRAWVGKKGICYKNYMRTIFPYFPLSTNKLRQARVGSRKMLDGLGHRVQRVRM